MSDKKVHRVNNLVRNSLFPIHREMKQIKTQMFNLKGEIKHYDRLKNSGVSLTPEQLNRMFEINTTVKELLTKYELQKTKLELMTQQAFSKSKFTQTGGLGRIIGDKPVYRRLRLRLLAKEKKQ